MNRPVDKGVRRATRKLAKLQASHRRSRAIARAGDKARRIAEDFQRRLEAYFADRLTRLADSE